MIQRRSPYEKPHASSSPGRTGVSIGIVSTTQKSASELHPAISESAWQVWK